MNVQLYLSLFMPQKGNVVKKMKLRSGFPSHKVIISLACSPCNGGKARVYMYRTTTHEVCGLDFEQSFFSVRTVKQSAQDARTSPSEFMLESRLYLKTQANKESTAISRKVVGKMCTRQSRKVIWDMINTLFLTLQLSNLPLLLSFSTRKHMSTALRASLSRLSLKNSDLKITHNTFRHCRVHFFRQPFSKQLYTWMQIGSVLFPVMKNNLICLFIILIKYWVTLPLARSSIDQY